MEIILIAGGGLIMLLLIIGIVITARSERSIVEERLGQYLEDEAAMTAEAEEERATPVTDLLNDILTGTSYGGGLSRELAQADLKLKPAEYVIVMFLSAVLVGLITWFISGGARTLTDPLADPIAVIIGMVGAVFGFFIPRLYVRRQKSKRLNNFNDQLADMLNLMVNGLRAGYSTMQAMEAVSKEMPPPISDEFRRVVQEMQLGLPMDEALENLLRRINSDDLDLVITAINVQREVGGNLAEILDTISYTIRERVRIKGEIRVLTSQVMYSGRFLALMPLIIIGVLWLLNREYMQEFNSLIGYIALSIGGLMILAGYFVMTRIANIDV
jgi:tight adherence protein B